MTQAKCWNPGLCSSATDDWVTDPKVFAYLDSIFQFTLDPCASHDNHKCERYFTSAEDGLLQSWAGERVFMNPPYGAAIGDWMRKACLEARGGALVVCLLPARTDTAWWHEYAKQGEVHLVRGRLKFVRGRLKFGTKDSNAPFPSAIVIFYPRGLLAEYEGSVPEPLPFGGGSVGPL